MAPRKHVALIVETSIIYGRRVLRGVTNYLRAHAPWSVFMEQRDLHSAPPKWLRSWKGDGIICRATTHELAAWVRANGVPMVDLCDEFPPLAGLPRLWSDHRAIGRQAAEHLLERGFRELAFCGFADHEFSRLRRDGFLAVAEERGIAPRVYESMWSSRGTRPWEREQQAIVEWLAAIPRPVGIMACNDMRGQHVLDACQRIELKVPEEAAVIGVDNDDILCSLCRPPLSSVAPNPERVGYEAAALLARMMAGEAVSETQPMIEPLGVVTRQSTDSLAIDDPEMAAAVRYIREHACDGANVHDVLAHVPLSRSLLERKFRKYLGRSPQAEIRAVQIKRVKELLAETDLPLERIAQLAGYKHGEYLSVVFKRETGQTPGQFRRMAQARK